MQTQAEIAEALRRENVALQQRVRHLQNILQQRSVPLVASLVDGLAGLTAGARAGDPNARQLLQEFSEALDAAKQSRLVVVNGHLPETH